MRSQFLVSFANRQLSMDAQQIELEIPGLPRQKNLKNWRQKKLRPL